MTTFTVDGTVYSTNEAGTYYYKTGTNGKKWRIAKQEWEQAWDEYQTTANDQAESDEEWDIENEINERKAMAAKKQAESDKMAEDAINAVKHMDAKDVAKVVKDVIKKAKAPRKTNGIEIVTKDITMTLTPTQADFIKELDDLNMVHGEGVRAAINTIVDSIGGQFESNPMKIGAMVSTLREKNLITVEKQKIDNKTYKVMVWTDLGIKVAEQVIKSN